MAQAPAEFPANQPTPSAIFVHFTMEPPPSPSNMSNKRKLLSSLGSSSAKRPCPSNADDDADMAPSSTSHPRNHPVYGQKSAFPGLDTTAEDELSYGPAEDGMEYLRMVR